MVCGSSSVIKWGVRSGKQRFKCKNCAAFNTWTNKGVSQSNRFIWFRRWIVGKQTFSQLVTASGYSERTLKRYFYEYLSNYPQWNINTSERVNLLIDGTYFSNKICLVLYRDNRVKSTLMYRLSDGEWLEELEEDLTNLLSLGICIESVTCDGLSNILKAVKRSSPDTVIQRCLAHIQRETLIWLTRRPKFKSAQELRLIIKDLHKIASHQDCTIWIKRLSDWYELYKDFINEKTFNAETGRYWFTHKSLRKAFVHINRALPNMFHYLDNPNIPKTTNSIESFFGHLKGNIAIHRGLSKEHYKNYIKWYLFFKSNEK